MLLEVVLMLNGLYFDRIFKKIKLYLFCEEIQAHSGNGKHFIKL